MSDPPPGTIERSPPKVPGADYAALRAEAVTLAHRMARSIWTDFNYSDPGVTIIEQLCYALTELPYRALLPVADLLAGRESAKVDLRRQGLMPAWSILPCNPVTANDLRRVTLDRVTEVANVWFTPCRNGPARGLYDIAVMPRGEPAGRSGCAGCADDALIQRVLACYRAHRGLCEDVHEAKVVPLVDTWVHASLELDDGADPSETLANALFALGLTLAPEPKRMSLAEQQAACDSSATVFAGPAMLRGFIADGELGAFPTGITPDDLKRVLDEIDGVLTSNRVAVEVAGNATLFRRDEALEGPPGAIFWLRGTTPDNSFTIQLTRNSLPIEPNSARVRRLLDQLWNEQRRTYPLRQEYDAAFGPGNAQWRDLAQYSPIKDQFPKLYGIGPGGLPAEASKARHGQASQLKGWLLPFDQLIADQFAQTAFLRDLFSIETGGDVTYAWNSLERFYPPKTKLLVPAYEARMTALVAANDPVETRQNEILDLLLSLYAQSLPDPAGNADDPDGGAFRAKLLLDAKRMLLRRVAPLSRNRGRGADYRRPRSMRNMAGAEAMSRIELGILQPIERPDRGGQAGTGGTDRVWGPAGDPPRGSFGQAMPDELAPALERHFQPLPPLDGGDGTADTPSPLDGRDVPPQLAAALGDPGRYRIGTGADAIGIYVMCLDAQGHWWWLGEHDDEEGAIAAIRRLLRAIRQYDPRPREPQLYLVEWLLLRAAGPDDRVPERYDFRVSAMVSDSRLGWTDAAWQQEAQRVLRANVPAHIRLDIRFLDSAGMRQFERLYDGWADAMQGCRDAAQANAAGALADFLEARPQPSPSPSPEPSPPPPTPTPTPEPTAMPTPAPTLPPEPTPEPTPLPSPAPTPAPTPEPDDDGHSHPVWGWISWFWTTWLLPILKFLFGWLLWLRRHHDDPEPTPAPTPLPSPEPTPLPSPTPTPEPTPGPTPEPTPSPTPLPTPEPTPGPTPTPTPAPTAAPYAVAGGVEPSQGGALGFDCSTPLTSSSARAFQQAGFAFAIRYVPQVTSSGQSDLTTSEADAILQAGLALMIVQHVGASGWQPTGQLGADNANCALAAIAAIDLPPGVTIFLDLEDVPSGTLVANINDYCNTWSDFITAAGYVPGIYIGANCGLNATQIVALEFAWFWQSGSTVPQIGAPGYAMKQTISSSFMISGVAYDSDLISGDTSGDTPPWLRLA